MMKSKLLCYFIIVLLAVGYLACGGDDDNEEDTQTPTTTVPTTTQSTEPVVEEDVELPEINVAVEDAAIRALVGLHDRAMAASDVDGVMEHWLDSRDTLMAQNFFGTPKVNKTFSQVRSGWRAVLNIRKDTAVSTIKTVRIDVYGQNATATGTLAYGPNSWPFIIAFRKDTEGDWKYFQADYGSLKLVEEIKPAQ